MKGKPKSVRQMDIQLSSAAMMPHRQWGLSVVVLERMLTETDSGKWFFPSFALLLAGGQLGLHGLELSIDRE